MDTADPGLGAQTPQTQGWGLRLWRPTSFRGLTEVHGVSPEAQTVTAQAPPSGRGRGGGGPALLAVTRGAHVAGLSRLHRRAHGDGQHRSYPVPGS